MKHRLSLFLTVVLLLLMLQPAPTARAAPIPTFSIVSVDPGKTVTIQTANFPANQTFTVRMGAFGTLGINGTVVGTTDSGAGGSFKATYTIPAAFTSAARVAIRMDSAQRFFAYNWFDNVSGGTPPNPSPGTGYTGIPTFSIVSVDGGKSVTVRTNNYPANQTFTVRMGAIGTRAVNGTVVGTLDSGKGGTFTASYNIPAALASAYQISIRMDSTQGFFAYNWFYNVGTTVPPPGPTPTPGPTQAPGYTGFPSFSIGSVVKGTSVTINIKNLPPNQTFTARMGAMGTLGINGTVVGTTDSGSGGSATVTYNIPAGLAGAYQIAIRMESPQGYFAYNWFYNVTYP